LPLQLNDRKFLKDASTNQERSKIGNSAFLTKDKENPFIIGETYEETYPIRDLSAASGGLVSSANDLEKFFREYSKMIFGLKNKITQNSNSQTSGSQTSGSQISGSQISELYQKHLASSGKVHHSLGVMLIENGDNILVGHYGGHAGNNCEPFVKVAATLQDFQEQKITDDRILDFEFNLQKKSALGGMLKYGTLFYVLEDYFDKKIFTLDQANQEEIKSKIIPDQAKKLKALNMLPENFSEFEAKIAKVTETIFFGYLDKSGLIDKTGVVDDEKLKENYEADKKNFYSKILDEKSKAQIDEILKNCEQKIDKNNKPTNQTFIEKLGLKRKPEETQQSFAKKVEKNRAEEKNSGRS
jgi:hypothetical protein